MTLVVAGCSHQAAQHAVEQWHYSHTMPVGKAVKFGAWEGGSFVGAVVFGRGANQHLGKIYGLTSIEVCELVRVALRRHDAPVSRIVAEAVRQLRQMNPRMRLVVSFADPNVGHHGGIYQAMNWLYLGQSDDGQAWKHKQSGRIFHNRMVSKTGYARQFGRVTRTASYDEVERVALAGKHRYALPLDKQMRRKLLHLAQPYPPAGKGSTASRPVLRLEGAGSNPAARSIEVAAS